MLITDKFVFLHFPKSGGSFVRSVLQHNYHTIQLPTYEKRKLYKIFNPPPFFIDHRESSLFEGVFNEYMLHNGCTDIPLKFKSLPLVTSIRNPFDFYISLYNNISAWEKLMSISNREVIKEDFPLFSEISFNDFFQFLQKYIITPLVAKHKIELKSDIGLYSVLLILQFFEEPKQKIEEISQNHQMDRFLAQNGEMINKIYFLNYNNLRESLYRFLCKFYNEKTMKFIFERPKVNVSERSIAFNWDNVGSINLKKEIEKIDNFGIRFFDSIEKKYN